jgi:biotin synthase-like enzyme
VLAAKRTRAQDCCGGNRRYGLSAHEDVVDLASRSVRELAVDSLRSTSSTPVGGTPLGGRPQPSIQGRALRALLPVRFLNPDADIRAAAAGGADARRLAGPRPLSGELDLRRRLT